MALTVTRPKKQKKPCLLCSSFRDEGSDPNLANPSGEPTCLWMMLRRKSGWRLRQRRWPKRSDWFRLFTCSRTCGGGLRGGPLSSRSKTYCETRSYSQTRHTFTPILMRTNQVSSVWRPHAGYNRRTRTKCNTYHTGDQVSGLFLPTPTTLSAVEFLD